MAASGCGRPGSGKGAVGHWRVASLLTILSSSSSTKSVSCLGQCLQSLSPTWFLRSSFLFCIFSSLVLPPWLFCPFLPCADWAMVLLPKAFHLDCLSHGSCVPWWLEQAGAGKTGKPCSPYGLLGPGQYKSGEWLARMQAYCRHSPSLSSQFLWHLPLHALPPSPWADQKCAIYCEPLPKTLGDGETLV